MAVTKMAIKDADGFTVFNFTYPSADVFLKERNYFIFEDVVSDYLFIKSVKIGDKTLNFGDFELLKGNTFYLDVSAYYAKYGGKFNVTIEYNDGRQSNSTIITINATTYDCYDPFKEIVPDRCGDAPYARIVPPYRMLWDGKKETSSLLSAMRDSDYFSGYEYEMDGVPYATYRPSNTWLTTEQKNEHLGETYRNTLPASGSLSDLDSNGNPLWIEHGGLLLGSSHKGKTFEEQRLAASSYCRAKTIFENYNGLTIGATQAGITKLVILYDANKQYVGNYPWTPAAQTLNNAGTYPYISIIFAKDDSSAITPSELVGITSSTLTNPEAGKSYRWVKQNGVFSWIELTKEQIVNTSFYWNIYTDDTAIPKNVDLVNDAFVFSKIFEAYYVKIQSISPTSKKYYRVASVKRVVSLADGSLPYVYIRWKTPWGVTVEHLFYLGSYTSDKADAKELESVSYYEELSQHVRVGSFYLDGIVQPYDLFYYKTLENAELVEMYFPYYAFRPNTYMPNGDDYVAIKVKSSDVAEAVVEGVAQRVITFKFELS